MLAVGCTSSVSRTSYQEPRKRPPSRENHGSPDGYGLAPCSSDLCCPDLRWHWQFLVGFWVALFWRNVCPGLLLIGIQLLLLSLFSWHNLNIRSFSSTHMQTLASVLQAAFGFCWQSWYTKISLNRKRSPGHFLVLFPVVGCVLSVLTNKLLSNLLSGKRPHHFLVLGFTFRPLTHFTLVFVYGPK